jgi:hypothetical protein
MRNSRSVRHSTNTAWASGAKRRAAGIEPAEVKSADTTPTPYHATKPLQNNTLTTPPTSTDSQKATRCTQDNNILQQPKCVPGVYQNIPDDLAKVVSAWDGLSEDDKQRIVGIPAGIPAYQLDQYPAGIPA